MGCRAVKVGPPDLVYAGVASDDSYAGTPGCIPVLSLEDGGVEGVVCPPPQGEM